MVTVDHGAMWRAMCNLSVMLAMLIVSASTQEYGQSFGRLVGDAEPTLPPPPDHRYNIKSYGAVGDGRTNDTDAFVQALQAALKDVNHSRVLVPAGRYLVWPVLVEECANTWIEIEGWLVAPQEPMDWPQNEYYIQFTMATNCGVIGQPGGDGGIEGNGMAWWERPAGTGHAPSLIVFTGMSQGYPAPGVANITLQNAPYAHVQVTDMEMYKAVEVIGVKMQSTDRSESAGITALNASVVVSHCDINVGGVHVMMRTEYGDNSHGFLRMDASTFHRGGGLVVQLTDGVMANFSLFQLKFLETSNAIRVLGAQDGSGSLYNLFFNDISMMNVGTPFIVDNYYCPEYHKGCTKPAKGVTIDYVSLNGVTATQMTGIAGTFNCLSSKPCFISLANVHILPSAPGIANEFHCSNAVGYTDDGVSPKSCLTKPSRSFLQSRPVLRSWIEP